MANRATTLPGSHVYISIEHSTRNKTVLKIQDFALNLNIMVMKTKRRRSSLE